MKFLFCLLSLLLLSSFDADGQKATLKGQVINTVGEAIPGIVVVEKKNPSNGTTTQIDGTFEITLNLTLPDNITNL